MINTHINLNGMQRLLEPLIAGEIRNAEAKELEKLKELVESSLAMNLTKERLDLP